MTEKILTHEPEKEQVVSYISETDKTIEISGTAIITYKGKNYEFDFDEEFNK